VPREGGARQRALVTGLAWTTALGTDPASVWDRLLAGQTGIREVHSDHPLRSLLAAPVAAPGPDGGTPRQRQHRITVDTAARALADAGVPADAPGLRLILGTSLGPHFDEPSPVEDAPLSDWADDAARALGAVNPPWSVTTACSSGSDAVLLGLELIASGGAELCLCGGVDVLTPAKRLGHSVLGTMTSTSLRAFDQEHDGTVLGEGSGFLVLESARSARARGVRAHGVVSGAASTNDASGLTAPDPGGATAAAAVQQALRASGRRPEDVLVVNAHGSGTVRNDEAEALALTRALGDGPLVFATKGAFGHTLGATGAIEAITVLLALRSGLVPAVVGLRKPAADCARLRLVADRPAPLDRTRPAVGLSLTLAFGGFNTCLVLEEAPHDGIDSD